MKCTIGALASVSRQEFGACSSRWRWPRLRRRQPLVAGQAANAGQPQVAVVQVESKAKRLHYLATAQIWTDPGELTPQALLAGPPLADGSGVEAALDGRPFPCTFAKPGKTMGGNTLKFSCTTATGQTIRVKYSDQSKKATAKFLRRSRRHACCGRWGSERIRSTRSRSNARTAPKIRCRGTGRGLSVRTSRSISRSSPIR